MRPEIYVLDTLRIELCRLKQEDRTEIHYAKNNENNQVCKDRWERIRCLEQTIILLESNIKYGRFMNLFNEFDAKDGYMPFKDAPYKTIS